MKLSIVEWMKKGRNGETIYEGEEFLLLKEVKYLSDESEILLALNNLDEAILKSVNALDIAPIAHIC